MKRVEGSGNERQAERYRSDLARSESRVDTLRGLIGELLGNAVTEGPAADHDKRDDTRDYTRHAAHGTDTAG